MRQDEEIRFIFKLVVHRLQVVIHPRTNGRTGSKEKICDGYFSLYLFFCYIFSVLVYKPECFYCADRFFPCLAKTWNSISERQIKTHDQSAKESNVKYFFPRHIAKITTDSGPRIGTRIIGLP